MLLLLHLEHIDKLNIKLEQLEAEIKQRIAPFNEADLVERLCTFLGVVHKITHIIIAELGTDMSRFPNAKPAQNAACLALGKNKSLEEPFYPRFFRPKTESAQRHFS